jgi:hypothetical protein
MTVLITLTTAGLDSGPFDLYSDLDGYVSAFESGVSKASLVAGYASSLVPDYTNTIRVKSNGEFCTNYVDMIVGTTTTTTSTSTTTTTTTTGLPEPSAAKIIYSWNLTRPGIDTDTTGSFELNIPNTGIPVVSIIQSDSGSVCSAYNLSCIWSGEYNLSTYDTFTVSVFGATLDLDVSSYAGITITRQSRYSPYTEEIIYSDVNNALGGAGLTSTLIEDVDFTAYQYRVDAASGA